MKSKTNRISCFIIIILFCLVRYEVFSQSINSSFFSTFLTSGDDLAIGYSLLYYNTRNVNKRIKFGFGFSTKKTIVNPKVVYNTLVVSGGNTSINNLLFVSKINNKNNLIDFEILVGLQKYVKFNDGGIILIQSNNTNIPSNYYQTSGSLINNYSFYYGGQVNLNLLKKSKNRFGFSTAVGKSKNTAEINLGLFYQFYF